MISDVPLSPLMATPREMRRSWATWQRRTIEVVVALLAFAVWGRLAYVGGYRILECQGNANFSLAPKR